MLQTTIASVSTVQRIARRLMLAMCLVLACGIITSAAAQGREARPVITHVDQAVHDALVLKTPVDGRGTSVPDQPARVQGKPAELTTPPAPPAATAKKLSSKSRVRTIWMEVTAYCPCKKCCGEQAHGVTASGKRVSYNGGRFVAADTDVLPFGTRVTIPGYNAGQSVEVIDTGGDIEGHRLDVFFKTHQQAMEWGRRTVRVQVQEAE